MIFRKLKRIILNLIPSSLLRYIPVNLLDLNRSWPSSIIIEPTNICNLACPVCPTFLEMDRPKGFMSYETFKFIIDDIKGKIRNISMNFSGEPTLNRALWRFVTYAQKNDVKVLVSTNSMRLAKQKDEILESGLDRIIVCLDGATKEVHEIYRRGSDFGEICRGIAMLCREKRVQGLEVPLIGLQFVVMAHNEQQVSEIIELGKELGVDALYLKSMSLGSSVKTAEEQLELARKWLPGDERFNRYDIVGSTIRIKKVPEICPWHKSGVIFWNGDVGICCYDFRGLHVFGNVLKDGGFTRLYKTPDWKKVQKKVMNKEFDLCRRCNMTTFEEKIIHYHENH